MPTVTDFRSLTFDPAKVDAGGKEVGRRVYWKLYAVENLVRVVVHSVLSQQINPGWWQVAVDADTQKRVKKFMDQYANQPWHSTPGRHEIYYTFLSDLSEIIRANSNLFLPVIEDIDMWIARIEQIRLPRNVVGHMNWPSETDRMRIDVFHSDLQQLVRKLAAKSGFTLVIP